MKTSGVWVTCNPKGPCAHIAYTLGPMYLYRESFTANVYTMGTWTLRAMWLV